MLLLVMICDGYDSERSPGGRTSADGHRLSGRLGDRRDGGPAGAAGVCLGLYGVSGGRGVCCGLCGDWPSVHTPHLTHFTQCTPHPVLAVHHPTHNSTSEDFESFPLDVLREAKDSYRLSNVRPRVE